MRKSNKAKNSTFSSNLLLKIARVTTMLSILVIVTLSSPVFSGLAFVSYGDDYYGDLSISDLARGSNNNNQEGGEDHSGLLGNLISQQQSPQAYARNVNADNKVIIVENCEDGKVIINDNDQIIQTNTQSFNQQANNQEGGEDHSGLLGNLISQQQSPQAYARNVNADNKVIIVENCEDGKVIINDNDQIIQTNAQSFNQEAYNQVGGEEEEKGEDDDG